MTKRALLVLMITSWLTFTDFSHAQQCRNLPAGVTQDTRFSTTTDDSVIDRRNHLVWMRCSVGQHWDREKKTCSGEAKSMTWFEARRLVQQPSYSRQGWRMPSIHELSSITELRCYDPAIDLRIFPDTPPSHYWTGTAFASKPGYFWLLQFSSGENHTDAGKRLAFVRLVKSLESDR